MELFFGLGLGLQAIASLVVGVRLLAMARRTRRFPEFAFGCATLGVLVVGFPMMVASGALDQAGVPAAFVIHAIGGLVVGFALTMNIAFTWRVFRPKSRLAAAFVGPSALRSSVGGFARSRPSKPSATVIKPVPTSAMAWAAKSLRKLSWARTSSKYRRFTA